MIKELFKKITIQLTIVLLLGTCNVYAHFLWLTAEKNPQQPDTMLINVGWGHHFPKVDIPLSADPNDQLEMIQIKGPEGIDFVPEKITEDQYLIQTETKGYYLAVAGVVPGYISHTTSGYQFGNKQEVKNVLNCNNYNLRAAVLFSVEDDHHSTELPKSGCPLEIIPLKTPLQAAKDGIFQVRVEFQGQPLAHATVEATYDGFSDEPDQFATSGMTDETGMIDIPLSHPGLWIVAVKHKVPHEDPLLCDHHVFGYTLTFWAESKIAGE